MAAAAITAQSAPKAGEVADGELVRRVRRGDDRAFEQLYHRYHRRITAYIHGMVHDHARAEDVAQDVFVSALRRMRETDRPIAFKPWVYEIAKNACIDQFRRSRRAEEVSYDADEGLGAADYGRLTSSEALPETELESKQSLDHLRGAFGGLSETHHEILVMRELEGLSYREIGERLGMSRPSVESTLFRARRRLTEEYEELVSGARCQRIQSIIASAEATVPGARDQRRLARHVSHCQPCRRQARLAGLDIPVAPDRPVRQRIAAVLPLPFFLRKRWQGEGSEATAVSSGPLQGFAQWSAQFGSSVDPSWFKAAATAATVAVAGAGAGLAGTTSTPGPAGAFGSILPSLGVDTDERRATAGVRPTVASALRTPSGTLAAPVTIVASAGTGMTVADTSSGSASGPAGGSASGSGSGSGFGSSGTGNGSGGGATSGDEATLDAVVDQAAVDLSPASSGGGSGGTPGSGTPDTDDSHDVARDTDDPPTVSLPTQPSAPDVAAPTSADAVPSTEPPAAPTKTPTGAPAPPDGSAVPGPPAPADDAGGGDTGRALPSVPVA